MFWAEALAVAYFGSYPQNAEPLGCPAPQDLALRILQSAVLEELWVIVMLAWRESHASPASLGSSEYKTA